MITLAFETTTITLHSDLQWVDENQWNEVEQSVERTITGAMIVSSAARQAGRPITLQPPDDQSAWMAASTVAALRNFAGVPGRVMTLTLGGQSRSVIFRHHDGIALEASPIVFYNDQQSTDWFKVTIRLMEI